MCDEDERVLFDDWSLLCSVWLMEVFVFGCRWRWLDWLCVGV